MLWFQKHVRLWRTRTAGELFLQKRNIIYFRFSPVLQYSNQWVTQLIAKGLLGLKLYVKTMSHSWENLRLEKMLLSIYWLSDTWCHTCSQQQKPIITKNLETSANGAWPSDNLHCSGPSLIRANHKTDHTTWRDSTHAFLLPRTSGQQPLQQMSSFSHWSNKIQQDISSQLVNSFPISVLPRKSH